MLFNALIYFVILQPIRELTSGGSTRIKYNTNSNGQSRRKEKMACRSLERSTAQVQQGRNNKDTLSRLLCRPSSNGPGIGNKKERMKDTAARLSSSLRVPLYLNGQGC